MKCIPRSCNIVKNKLALGNIERVLSKFLETLHSTFREHQCWKPNLDMLLQKNWDYSHHCIICVTNQFSFQLKLQLKWNISKRNFSGISIKEPFKKPFCLWLATFVIALPGVLWNIKDNSVIVLDIKRSVIVQISLIVNIHSGKVQQVLYEQHVYVIPDLMRSSLIGKTLPLFLYLHTWCKIDYTGFHICSTIVVQIASIK